MSDDEILEKFDEINARLEILEKNVEVIYKGLLEVAKSNSSNNGIGNIMNMFPGMMQ